MIKFFFIVVWFEFQIYIPLCNINLSLHPLVIFNTIKQNAEPGDWTHELILS